MMIKNKSFSPTSTLLANSRAYFVRLVKVSDVSNELELAWREIRASRECYRSPYYALEFVRAVDRIRTNVEIAIVENREREIVAFFPFRRVSSHKAEPVGGLLNDLHGVMVVDGVELTIEMILDQCNLGRFIFHSSPEDDTSEQYLFRTKNSYHIDLSRGWEDYLRWIRKHSSTVKRQPQKSRAMELLGDVRFEFDCVDIDALEQLIALKRSKYQRTNTFDILSVQWAADLLRDIHSTSRNDFQGILSVIWLDDKMVAAHFGMMNGDVLHYWFPTFDIQFSKYSPGTQLILKVAETAASNGIRMIDFGYGDDPYKLKFCNGRETVMCGQVDFNPLAFQLAKQRHIWRNQLKKIPLKSAAKSILREIFPRFGQWNFK